MKTTLELVIIFIASLNLLLSRFALLRIHQPTTLLMWMIKVVTSALSPILFLIGIVSALFGWILNFTPLMVIGGLGAVFYLIHIIKVTRPPDPSMGFAKAFEAKQNLEPQRQSFFLPRRYVFYLPSSTNAMLSQDITFYTTQESSRPLLCDIWQSPTGIKNSGLAFIYLHGSAWSLLDKDFGTRIFFKRLTSQGHVVMDVAYRLFPETDFIGMVHDAKHAIAWMKLNASKYKINPDRIVIGGGSAGAHLALLAAYTAQTDKLSPADLIDKDLSVRGVISLYGQSDLTMTFYHTAQHLVSRSALSQKKNKEAEGRPSRLQKMMGSDFHRLGFDKNVEPGMLTPMLGGNPNQVREEYSRFSPIAYVHRNCPPTLLIHGEHDILAPLVAIKSLKKKLKSVEVPVVLHIIPQTDHAFDLILPKISPSAHNALYDVERFLEALI